MNIVNGALSMRTGGGRNTVVGRVNPGGSITNVSISGPVIVGTSSGSGQISEGRITLRLQWSDPRFTVPCNFTYEASKAV